MNVYQAVRSDIYALSFAEYWQGFERVFGETDIIAVGEPLVRARAGLPPLSGGCGVGTVRVTPRSTSQPCVNWPGPGEPLSNFIALGAETLNSPPFRLARNLPAACSAASFAILATAGAPDAVAGRRSRTAGLLLSIIRGERRNLPIRIASNRDLLKLGSSCTTVVIACDDSR